MPIQQTEEDEYMDEELGDDLGDDFKDPECFVCDDRGCAECDDDNPVSPTEVYSRAKRHFGGNHDLAREAAEMYPGDFVA